MSPIIKILPALARLVPTFKSTKSLKPAVAKVYITFMYYLMLSPIRWWFLGYFMIWVGGWDRPSKFQPKKFSGQLNPPSPEGEKRPKIGLFGQAICDPTPPHDDPFCNNLNS